ncbi:hypothetical protein [Streptococcus uberis]|uniref:hypothetical protein n=1 Tax=Streptococcus uberis TaxID=1349 RepID=UPI00398EDF80
MGLNQHQQVHRRQQEQVDRNQRQQVHRRQQAQVHRLQPAQVHLNQRQHCLLYTSDAADDTPCLGIRGFLTH